MVHKVKLRPVLDGDFRLLGLNPACLDIPAIVVPERNPALPDTAPTHECVDHHIYQSADGAWHLWGCIRKTTVGRILYRWEGRSLRHTPWQPTGDIIRVDRNAGESLAYHQGEECIQSPFVVVVDGTYYMFYGGDGSGINDKGESVAPDDPTMAGQMCLMTSSDGRAWVRHHNEAGQSRVFVGPMGTRDPCLLHIDGLWIMYYAGYHGYADGQVGFYARTSADLIRWSERTLVHLDSRYGGHRWQTECPHVVYRQGYYYLFRTAHYASAETYVFRSEDPMDFGIGDASTNYVCPIAVAAPEIILDQTGNEYITSNHDLAAGTMLCSLRWVDDCTA
jgi:hypothetical protein